MPPASNLSVAPADAPVATAAGGPFGLMAGAWAAPSLQSRLRWLVGGVVLLCLLAALGVQQWAGRGVIQQQLLRQDAAAAALLAQSLANEAAQAPALRERLLAAFVEATRPALLQLRDAEGRVLWQRRDDAAPLLAPLTYQRLIDLEPPATVHKLLLGTLDGPRQASVHLLGRSADAVDALWQGLLQAALALALLGGLVLAYAGWRVQRLRRALADSVAQADALRHGRFLRVETPPLPELAPLAASMNLMVDRLQGLFDTQAAQIELLRRQACLDPLTGLPLRRQFGAQFEQLLTGDAAPARFGVLMLRVRDLPAMNRRVGHATADLVLQAVAQTLASYPRHSDGCFAGRLNGADFALVLPVGGLAQETAQALVQALRVPLVGLDAAASVSIGAAELGGVITVTQALALADEALARAEADHAFACAVLGDSGDAAPYGEALWQQRLALALEQGRVALASFPVCTADGRVLHLDCPMRVQIEPGGPFEPASRWLAQAARARLCAEVDERAVALALQAIDEDGQARCINISAQALGVSDFMAAVSRRLEAAPQAATRLWIDLPEALALDRPALVQEAARRWRPLGVYLGIEHAGDALARIPRLLELGLDCVRIDGRHLYGVAEIQAADMRRYLRGLVQLVQSVGLSITAEGVRREEDLALLWTLGFDAATGPVVQPVLETA